MCAQASHTPPHGACVSRCALRLKSLPKAHAQSYTDKRADARTHARTHARMQHMHAHRISTWAGAARIKQAIVRADAHTFDVLLGGGHGTEREEADSLAATHGDGSLVTTRAVEHKHGAAAEWRRRGESAGITGRGETRGAGQDAPPGRSDGTRPPPAHDPLAPMHGGPAAPHPSQSRPLRARRAGGRAGENPVRLCVRARTHARASALCRAAQPPLSRDASLSGRARAGTDPPCSALPRQRAPQTAEPQRRSRCRSILGTPPPRTPPPTPAVSCQRPPEEFVKPVGNKHLDHLAPSAVEMPRRRAAARGREA